jgi:hypothetical protein
LDQFFALFMDTIAIISRVPFSLESIRAILEKDLQVYGPGDIRFQDTLVVQHGGTRAYLHPPLAEGSPDSGYELLIDYRDIELAKIILGKIADDPALIIDDNEGPLMPGDEFVAKCRTGWNWRQKR